MKYFFLLLIWIVVALTALVLVPLWLASNAGC